VLAGSDYPHQIGSIPSMLAALRGLPIPDADSAKILGGNAVRIYGLSS
jgi:predicted TIM-barrel fold metal-dependent hydrolase